MKKWFVIVAAILSMAVSLHAETLTSRHSAYTLVDTSLATGNDSDFGDSDFVLADHSSDADADFRKLDRAGASEDTFANGCSLIFAGDPNDNDTATLVVYGAGHTNSPWIRIASLALTVGTADSASGFDWVDTIVATDTHATTIVVSDSTNNRVANVTFDLTGLRFLKFLVTATGVSGPEAIIKTYIRWW